MKVTDLTASRGDRPVFICDFSPPRFADWNVVQRAAELSADFLCVAYNPGKAVRVDSAMLASTIKTHTGKETVFNLATRDMNRLALQTHLLGAQMLGLENVVVVKGDDFTARDLERVRPVDDYLPTELIRGAAALNQGVDFRGSQLRAPTDLCVGASIDLGRGIQTEAALAHRKVQAGAQFFITQPVFSLAEIDAFHGAYREAAGHGVEVPVFFGLQVMIQGGVVFFRRAGECARRVGQGQGRVRDGPGTAADIHGERGQQNLPGAAYTQRRRQGLSGGPAGARRVQRVAQTYSNCVHNKRGATMASLQEEVGQQLVEKGLKIAVAEACTGGLVGSKIISVPGSSKYFIGGVIAYTGGSKTKVLGVSQEVMDTEGSVSPKTAVAMAERAWRLMEADIGVSTTGVAGPGPGRPGFPVGLFYIGLSAADGYEASRELRWNDDRNGNRDRTADAVLEMVKEYLAQKS